MRSLLSCAPALLVIAAILAVLAVPAAHAQDVEWRSYGSDAAGTKYSPLDQINRETIGDLQVVWRQSVLPEAMREGRDDFTPPVASQNTPLMADGRLYISSALGTVAALDATTGEVLWFDTPPDRDGESFTRVRQTRGVAYWDDPQTDDARVLAVVGSHLVALNAGTGERYPDFGDGGEVDLTQGFDRPMETFSWGSPPLVVGDIVVIGSAMSDVTNPNMPAMKEMPPGDVRGFDVRTGEQVWIFHVIPREGEPGNETWLTALTEDRASWEYSGNTNMWAWPSADEELGLVYVPLSTPTNDYYGGYRPGDNLFAESLVCLDARTGERVWHFQAVHHGIWDYDFPAAPNVLDLQVEGRSEPVKAIAAVSKQAFTYVFDRVTGEPIWPIEERPVPPGDVPGEWYAATQPFPTRPPAFDQQGTGVDDLIDFTPELRHDALEVFEQYTTGPLFTAPALVDESPGGTKGTLQMPGVVGGADWGGSAVDPETGILYVPSVHSEAVIGIVPSEHPRSDMRLVVQTLAPLQGAQRAADLQAAVRAAGRHRPQEGRDPLVEGQRRRTARPSGAEGPGPAAARSAGARLAAGDEVVRVPRRGRQRRGGRPAADLGRSGRQDVPRLRQADRRRGVGDGAARRHDIGADDLHGRRPAVHRRHRRLGGHAERVRRARATRVNRGRFGAGVRSRSR